MSEPISYLETPWGQAVIEGEPDVYDPPVPRPHLTGFGAALPFLIGGLGGLAAILAVVSTLRPWLVIEEALDQGFGGSGSVSLRESVDPWGRLTLSGPAASGIDLQSGAHQPRYALLMVAAALVLCAAGTAVVVFRGRIWPGLLGILGAALLLPAVAAPLVEWDSIRSQFAGRQGGGPDVRLAGGVWIGTGAALLAIIVLGLSVDLVYRSITARIAIAVDPDPSENHLGPDPSTAPGHPGYDPFGTHPGYDPFGTQPAGTQPFGTQPFGTQPFGTQPFGTQPAGTQPTETWSAPPGLTP